MSSSNLRAPSWLRHTDAASLAADMIAHHEHLLIEILIRLPVKYLVKFKGVCKHWNFLISSPVFCRAQFLSSRSDYVPISGVFLRRTCIPSAYAYQFLSFSNLDVSFLSLPSPSPVKIPGSPVQILQSCNGLLLYYGIDSFDSNFLNLYVYNPTTTQLTTLPSIQSSFLSAVLVLNPYSSTIGYKVISIHTTGMSRCFAIRIYSSEAGLWLDWKGNFFQVPYHTALTEMVYWGGAIHWICRIEDSFYLKVDQEKVLRMPSPPVSWMEKGHPKFCESQGNLCYIWHEYGSSSLRIYMMETYEAGWYCRSTMDLEAVTKEHRILNAEKSALSVLCLANSRETDGEGRCIMVIHVPGKVLAYDLKDEATKVIYNAPLIEEEVPGKLQFHWFDASPYTLSFACV